MQKLIDGFKVMDGDNVVDEFFFYNKGNNHGSVYNGSGCLFDGYYLEAQEAWKKVVDDMAIVKAIGFHIERY